MTKYQINKKFTFEATIYVEAENETEARRIVNDSFSCGNPEYTTSSDSIVDYSGDLKPIGDEITEGYQLDENGDYNAFQITPEQREELNAFPYLKSYVEQYIENEGVFEPDYHLPKLVYFFKRMCLDNNLNEQSEFGWNEEIAEDFYGWGSNSRWSNTFDVELKDNFKAYIDVAINFAKRFGDKDIYANDGE